MKRMVAVLVLLASLLVSLPSHARPTELDPASLDFEKMVRTMSGSVVIPNDWDGVWSTLDSVYVCDGAFQQTSMEMDTICGGQAFTEEPPNSPFEFTCKGTATGSTIMGTCTAAGEAFPDCQVSVVINFESTRTGSTYVSVTTVTSTYTGTGKGCNLIPDSCTRIVDRGTRTGPGPVNFCTTAAQQTTWGKLKTIYR